MRKGTVTRVRTRDGRVREERARPDGSYEKISETVEVLPSYLEHSDQGFAKLSAFVHNGTRWARGRPPVDAKKQAKRLDLLAEEDEDQEKDDVEEEEEEEEGGGGDAAGGRRSAGQEPNSRGALKLVTYNVWFAREDQLLRARGLLAVVEAQQPDVVCLQEVTVPFLECLLAEPWVQRDFVVSDNATGTTVNPYGVAMLVRKATPATPWLQDPEFTIHHLPSNMGRRALFASLASGNLRVGTAHLESLDNAALRIAQLDVVGGILHGSPHHGGSLAPAGEPPPITAALFAGDTNFGERCPEADAARSALVHASDVWPCVHGEGSVGKVQTMLREKIGRLDKVYCQRGSGSSAAGEEASATRAGYVRLEPTDIGLLGTAPCHVKEDGTEVFPSDHAGVTASFVVEMG